MEGPTLLDSLIVTAPILAGLPLQATWGPALCLCLAGSCQYTIQVQQWASSGPSALSAQPVSNGNSTSATVTDLQPLLDGATLVVQVQCVDAYGRRSLWANSTTVLVVTTSRTVDVDLPSSQLTGQSYVDIFQQSSQALSVTLRVWPPVVVNVSVLVTRVVAPTVTTAPGNVTWVRIAEVWLSYAAALDSLPNSLGFQFSNFMKSSSLLCFRL